MNYGKHLFHDQYASVAAWRVQRMLTDKTKGKQQQVLVRTTRAKNEIVRVLESRGIKNYKALQAPCGFLIRFKNS